MERKTVVVASKNPVKVNAALGGLQRMFHDIEFVIFPYDVPSGVSNQPMSDEETLKGAINRVKNATTIQPEADFWIGIEGGVTRIENKLAAFAWVVTKSKELTGKARSGTFFLPPAVQALINQGMELGTADDTVFGHSNSKQKGGAIGLLTDNVVDRKELYEQAVVLALIPFKNEVLYKSDKEQTNSTSATT